ncbi:MAG TPA: Hpt domain-containing protein [Oligoflexus sp.]|uniref:Hpt domain-containing protein n=1 Tax=Oligoflexus sp. TaxID=1971216 RepID=UPI002D7ED8B4|nr:Hpt domain-containing protein [Oligoflexus sp.]HET9241332.1 Hpt domain-containing protein [Oligoflexus sp.]
MEISEVFRDELNEEFSRLELILLSLEKKPEAALMEQAQRILHNMKGSSRVAGFEACGRVIHYLETLLLDKPLPLVLETILSGMDLSLSLAEPEAHPGEADRFIQKPLPLVPRKNEPLAPQAQTAAQRDTALRVTSSQKTGLVLPEHLRVLVTGDRQHLRAYQNFLDDHSVALQWRDTTEDIAIVLQENIVDAVVLDFSSLDLVHGCLIRKIRRASESLPILLLADSIAPCLLLQLSRQENISCFLRPLLTPQMFLQNLEKRIIKGRQAAMFSRALRAVWFLDPQQDPCMAKDARTLMHYQDKLRAVASSHQDWDFENHSHMDKRLTLSDVHGEIELVLHDLIHRIDQKTLPFSLVRLRHRHLLDCIQQHFLEENVILRDSNPCKKFLEQHVKHHDEAMQEFHSQRLMRDPDGIRFFCDSVTSFIRQHASFDETLEEYLLRDSA